MGGALGRPAAQLRLAARASRAGQGCARGADRVPGGALRDRNRLIGSGRSGNDAATSLIAV